MKMLTSKPKNNKIKTNNFAEKYGDSKKWYQEIAEDPENFPSVPEDVLIKLKDEAKKCNDAEVATYNIKNSKTNSEYQWMKTVMSKGTVADKVAAYTLLIQDDPVCNLQTIYNMINMVKVGKKKECIFVMETLTELFLSDLLRPNVKLKSFHQRPLSKLDELTSGNSVARKKYLSIWYFEDQLKEYYTSFILALNTAAQDTVDANKEKAIIAMFKLLVGNAEQEKNLLTHIVNKLGDPSQKIASKAIYCLGQILYEHPAMKQVVLNEIERLLFRPNISPKAQYYGICFLSQFVLTHEDFDVAKNLIGLYFSFFKACVKKEEVDSRMMSALLTGVNRAYPYAQSELEKISEHIDTMYKVVHVSTFNVSIHALNLLFQISDFNNSIKDRFYTALYKKLLDFQIGSSKQQALYLNLIYRAVKKDPNVNRTMTFIKRLLQLALYMQPSVTCAILFLIQNLIKQKKNLLKIISVQNMDDDDDDSKVKIELEGEQETEKEPNEIESNKNEENNLPEKDKNDSDENKTNQDVVNVSWDHSAISIKSEFNHPDIKDYNPMQRNPLYAGGQFCVYWELLNLQRHFHPTVSLYANKILNAENIVYSGDPLKDFTLIRFLERFSFRNPKKANDVEKKGVNPVFGKRQLQISSGIKSHAVNSQQYLSANQNKIPVEELFMYTYLQRKNEEKQNKGDDDDSDIESVASEEFEEMLDKMSGKHKGDDDEDFDLDFMNDIGDSLKSKDKKKKGKSDDDEDEDDDDIDDDENDMSEDENDELQFSGDDDMVEDEDIEENGGFEDHADDDDDDDDFDNGFDDNLEEDSELSDDFEEEPSSNKNQKTNKKLKKKNTASVFASADEFAELLDEEPDFMAGSSQALSNKDNAHKKQLNWEMSRDRWIKGYNKAVGKKKDKSNNKQFGKKRQKPQKHGNKNKKQKKH